jgi:Flp pilus assembly protein TadG
MNLSKKAVKIRPLRVFWTSRDGMAFVYAAILLPVLTCLAALVIDMGYAVLTRQRAQTAADAAAFGGRIALEAGEDVAAAAKAVAALNGFDVVSTNGATDTSLTVRVYCNVSGQCPDGAVRAPPDTSYASYVGDINAVQVVIEKTNKTTFARLMNIATLPVNAWAVATDLAQDTYCILGLGQGANADSTTNCSTGIGICGNGNVDYGFNGTKCGIASNSADPVSNGGRCKSGVGSADFRGGSANVWGPFYACGGANAKTSIFQSTFVTNPTPPAPIVDPYVGNGQKGWLTGLASKTVTTAAGTAVALSSYLASNTGNVLPSDPGSCGAYTAFSTPTCCKKCTPPDIPTFSDKTYCYNNMTSSTVSLPSACPTASTTYVVNGSMTGGSVIGNGSSVFEIADMRGGKLSGSGNSTFDIGAITSSAPIAAGAFGAGVYNINSLDGTNVNAGAFGSGTYVINTLNNAPSGMFNTGTFYVNNMDATSLAAFNGMRSNCANITYTPATVGSGTMNGCGRYSIGTFSGGTLDGANGGLFLLGSVTGGTLQNGVFYINSLSGSVTTTNATLVVFSSPNGLNGWSGSSISGPTSNTVPVSGSAAAAFDGSPKNAGFALTSPNGLQFSKSGNDSFTLRGAIYLPGNGSEFHLQGNTSISWTCGQLIAGLIELGGNAGMNVDNSCGLTQITGNAHGSRLVQ